MTLKIPRLVGSITLALIASCAPVRLLESNDPRIEEGVGQYQEALEGFVQSTLVRYEECAENKAEMRRLSAMTCQDGSDEVRALCADEIEADKRRVSEAVEVACTAASYAGNRESFYIPQEARLSVLKNRAAVLDSVGVCGAAVKGVANFVAGLVPEEVRRAVGTTDEGEPANCTQILVQTVLDNHRALGNGHKRLDAVDAQGGDAAAQAALFLPTQRDTLVQNVRIVLFLEQAKKRGDATP